MGLFERVIHESVAGFLRYYASTRLRGQLIASHFGLCWQAFPIRCRALENSASWN